VGTENFGNRKTLETENFGNRKLWKLKTLETENFGNRELKLKTYENLGL
jgi:hypothetical protein